MQSFFEKDLSTNNQKKYKNNDKASRRDKPQVMVFRGLAIDEFIHKDSQKTNSAQRC